jgi:hypothetical protein
VVDFGAERLPQAPAVRALVVVKDDLLIELIELHG